jgi:hypothetical protein
MSERKSEVKVEKVDPDLLTTALFGFGNSGGGHRVSGGNEPPRTHPDRESAVKDAADRLRRDK